jgi:hypothetical protein
MVTRRTSRSRRGWPEGVSLELLTGHDYFHDSLRGDIELRRQAWNDSEIRQRVYDLLAERRASGSPPEVPWAEIEFGVCD